MFEDIYSLLSGVFQGEEEHKKGSIHIFKWREIRVRRRIDDTHGLPLRKCDIAVTKRLLLQDLHVKQFGLIK